MSGANAVIIGFGIAVVVALHSWAMFVAGMRYAHKLVRFDVDLQEWSDDNRPRHHGKKRPKTKAGAPEGAVLFRREGGR